MTTKTRISFKHLKGSFSKTYVNSIPTEQDGSEKKGTGKVAAQAPKKPAAPAPKIQLPFQPESSLKNSGFCKDCSSYASQEKIGPNPGMVEWCRRKTLAEKKYQWIYKRILPKHKIKQCPAYKKRMLRHMEKIGMVW